MCDDSDLCDDSDMCDDSNDYGTWYIYEYDTRVYRLWAQTAFYGSIKLRKK